MRLIEFGTGKKHTQMSQGRQHHRRDFISGRMARGSQVPLALQSVDGQTDTDRVVETDHYLVKVGRRAMACQFEVLFNAGQYSHATQAAMEALDEVDRLEELLSSYRESSEISRINVWAADTPVHVCREVFELLEHSIALSIQTNGAFDITAGPLTTAWGFDRQAGNVPDSQRLTEALAVVGSDQLCLDEQSQTVSFMTPGMRINLGAIGKGYALDRAAQVLTSNCVNDFLWHGGLSSVLARGQQGSTPDQGWKIGLPHPVRPGERLGVITLRDAALATSGSQVQFFRHHGQRYGHILDPRTGLPAEGILTSTVVAPTATDADALSTAFYVLGPQAALDWCRDHEQFGAILVIAGPGGTRVVTAPADWPAWAPLVEC